MEAIILAGGLGTRLRLMVQDLPKPMAPVNGKPFLEYIIKNLIKCGFSRIILSVGFKAEKIEQYFGDSYEGVDLVYSSESEPLGTGGATRLALEHCKENHVYVFNGDTYLDVDVAQIERLWIEKGNPIIVGKIMPDASRYGVIVCCNGRVAGFKEKVKNGSGLINAGCYVLRQHELEAYPIGKKFSLEKDYLEVKVNSQALNLELFITNGYFIDMGIPESYLEAIGYFQWA